MSVSSTHDTAAINELIPRPAIATEAVAIAGTCLALRIALVTAMIDQNVTRVAREAVIPILRVAALAADSITLSVLASHGIRDQESQ